MVLQQALIFGSLLYRTSFETSGANDRQIVELHWRDFAVFVSLSSRTNTRQGLALVLTIRRQAGCARATLQSFLRKLVVRGL
jgi:hypothetical protein